MDKYGKLKTLREAHLKEMAEKKSNKIINEAPSDTGATPTDDKLKIDITNLTDIKKAYLTLKSGFSEELSGITFNRQTSVAILSTLLIAERIKQIFMENGKNFALPLLKKLKERYNISDDFIANSITKKFPKLKALDIDASKLEQITVGEKAKTNESLSIEDMTKMVDNVLQNKLTNSQTQSTAVEVDDMNDKEKLEYKTQLVKVWNILKPIKRITLNNFDKIVDKMERSVIQFKMLGAKEGKQGSEKMDKLQNFIFLLFFISLKDKFKNIMVNDIINKVVEKDKKEVKESVEKKNINKLFEEEFLNGMTNMENSDISTYDKIQPQYMTYLIQWEAHALQTDFNKWKQFFEFSFKNALMKVDEKERMFIEIMKIVFKTLKQE